MAIYRATTPTQIFRLPFSVKNLDKIQITYAQNGQNILTKTELDSDCSTYENAIMVKLTQEETLQFEHSKMVRIQLRVKTKEGDVLSSRIMEEMVGVSLDANIM